VIHKGRECTGIESTIGSADTAAMASFSAEVWLLLAVVAACTITSILLALAHQFGQEREVHDLRAEVTRLREAYRKRLSEGAEEFGSGSSSGTVEWADVVEDSTEAAAAA